MFIFYLTVYKTLIKKNIKKHGDIDMETCRPRGGVKPIQECIVFDRILSLFRDNSTHKKLRKWLNNGFVIRFFNTETANVYT